MTEHNRLNMKHKNYFVSTGVKVKVLCTCKTDHIPTRRNKNLIRFLESFIMLPVIVAMPLGSVFGVVNTTSPTETAPKIALIEHKSLMANGLFAINQEAEEQKIKAENELANLKLQAEAIDNYFKARNLPLEGTGMKMATEAKKYDLDYRLMPAIAMIETTGGKNLCKSLKSSNNKNPFGWGSCKIGFSSFDKAIEVIAMNISGNNPNTAHHYGSHKTTKELLETYNPPRIKPGYAAKVMKVMDIIGKKDLENNAEQLASA